MLLLAPLATTMIVVMYPVMTSLYDDILHVTVSSNCCFFFVSKLRS